MNNLVAANLSRHPGGTSTSIIGVALGLVIALLARVVLVNGAGMKLEINTGSADYNERDKKGVFYSESWALVHYLMLGKNGQRHPQLIQFLGLLGKGLAPGEAFQQAFQTDYATMEKELREYINRNSYPVQVVTTDEKLQFDATMQAEPLGKADAQFYLGDLLLHMNRLSESEEYLQRAITLNGEPLAVEFVKPDQK